ncbi:MAG: YggS family pyridoxal phosphate-dependent enzyme [Acholeplasmatales bacterium]|jgi:pyridoxal phosphate enzyme (YggS family)|nr:YggS family pyridoxal phosphate-dependent enzyme [Acholeplasmatales bacterium]
MFKDLNALIVVASKNLNVKEIEYLYKLGYHDFGENKVSSLLVKKNELKDLNINWHFIGNLQTNKVKDIINEVVCIHSIYKVSQVRLIEKYSNKIIPIFLEINYLKLPSRSGLEIDEVESFIEEIKKYKKIKIAGLMVIGAINNNLLTEEIFSNVSILNEKLGFNELSMGMSDDYEIALKYRGTTLRIGRKIREELPSLIL